MTNDDTQTVGSPKRFRSPPYPAIGLREAVERATQLHARAAHHAVGVNVLAQAWGYTSTSGSMWATAAALIQFGLLTDDGTGDKRKFQLTDAAIRIVRDVDPQSEKRRAALTRAALLPKIYGELWEKYGDGASVSEFVLQNYLTLDRKDEGKAPYGADAAQIVISEYKETVTFAGLQKSDTVTPTLEDMGSGKEASHDPDERKKSPPPIVKVGDHVQWKSNGVDQFRLPKRVEWLAEDGLFARVTGSPTGIPVSELTVKDASTAKAPPATAGENPIEVFMAANGRLQVSADVDVVGLQKLRDLLAKYDEILKLMG